MEQEKEKKNKIMNQIREEYDKLTGDMMHDMDSRDKIHKLRMELKGVTPDSPWDIECVGCGS
jgi:hypothetical protein